MKNFKDEFREINILSSEELIVDFCKNIPFRTELSSEEKSFYLDVGSSLLHLRQQRNMQIDQNEFYKMVLNDNKENLKATKDLVRKTGNLVVATWFLVIVTLFISLVK